MNPAISTSLALLLLCCCCRTVLYLQSPAVRTCFPFRVFLTYPSEEAQQPRSVTSERALHVHAACDIPSKNQTGTGRGQTKKKEGTWSELATTKGLCTPPSYCPTHRGGHVAERIDKICLDRKTFHTFDTPTTYQLHDFPGFSRIWRVRWCSW
jgi:hypothetical protein